MLPILVFLQCNSVGVGDALELFLGQFVALNDVLVALQPREGAFELVVGNYRQLGAGCVDVEVPTGM